MKYSLLFSAFLLSTMMVGCSDNPIEENFSIIPEDQAQRREITVGVGDQYGEDAKGSRVGVDTSDSSMWSYLWASDDKVLGWDDTGSSSPFSMSSLVNNYAIFAGTADAAATNMRLIYPCDEEMVADGVLTIDVSSQSIDLSDPANSFAKENLYMISDQFAATEVSTTTGSMNHLLSIVELVVVPNGITDDLYLKSATIKGLNLNAATVNFATAELTATGEENTITLNFTNPSKLANNIKYTTPFSVIPYTAAAGADYSVSLAFTDGRSYGEKLINGESTLKGVKSFTKNFTFRAGERTPLTVAFNASTDLFKPIKNKLSEFSGEMDIVDDIWFVTDVVADDAAAFEGLEAAIVAANAKSIYPKVIFENLVAFPTEAFCACKGTFSVEATVATTIGNSVFDGCSNLTALTLPSVESVGGGAFASCAALTELSLPSLTDTDVNGDYTYAGLASVESLSLPSYTDLSYNGTFFANSSMTSVKLPNLLTISGGNTFKSCTQLSEISLPVIESLDGANIFNGCTLTELTLGTLGEGLTKINAGAFENCVTGGVALSLCAGDNPNFAVEGNVMTIDGISYTFSEILVKEVAPAEVPKTTLAEVSATTYPSGDTWIITDATAANAAAFDNLELAIAAANTAGTTPHIIFSELETLKDSAFKSCSAKFSVELTAATVIEAFAFDSAYHITSIIAKKLTSISGANILRTVTADNSDLVTMELGTEGDGLKTFNKKQNSVLTNVELKIKIASSLSSLVYVKNENELCLDGANSAVGAPSFSLLSFKSIHVIE